MSANDESETSGQEATELRKLLAANKKLAFQYNEKTKLADMLFAENKKLVSQQDEKDKLAAELAEVNKELVQQNEERKERAIELVAANEKLVSQQGEKDKLAAELVTVNKELVFQNEEKEKRAIELVTANKELAIQQDEKDRRAAELVIANKELVYQNEEKEKRALELNTLAFYDVLTGLPNRRLIIDKMHRAVTHSTRSGDKGAVMFIDLDKFKDINDTRGHEFGDMLLKALSQRLDSCLRDEDTVGRLGGDEFVVILEHISEDTGEVARVAQTVGDKILATLGQPYQLTGQECLITVSIGVTLFSEHAVSAEELLKRAHMAMFEAKQAGRNSLRFFNPDMKILITERVALEQDLKAALQLDQFVLNYQIQVDSSHRVLGVESLIRWQHPERGFVSPAEFIPLTEETGLIVPIGLWVLETACRQLEAWQQNSVTRGLVISVNISARQFHQPDFVSQVMCIVQRHNIIPKLLKLEITESLLIESIDKIIESMKALKAIGIQFSLDDFGTGYSSLRHLKRLPLDEVKIDLSFVRNIVSDSGDRAIVSAIITMAQSLGLEVIAEGVETVEQQQTLLEAGCSNYQGYLFSRPVSIGELERMLPDFHSSI